MDTFSYEEYFKNDNTLFAFSYTDPENNEIEHTHEFNELVIVDKGCGVQVFNGDLYFIQEGDIFLVKEGDRHFYNELGTLKLMNLQINTRYRFQYLQQFEAILEQTYVKNGENFIWLMPKDKDFCVNLIRRIPQIYRQPAPIACFQAETAFMQILSTIMLSHSSIQHSSTQYKIRNILIYLQRNYAQEIDWLVLSDLFFITYKTMTRKLKELTGMTPVNYLNRLRLLSARDKLRHSDDSVTDIAGLCGFNNSDYFAKCYKKHFALSPSDERKNHL